MGRPPRSAHGIGRPADTTTPTGAESTIMKEFDSYSEAKKWAEDFTRKSGQPTYVAKPTAYQSWTAGMLPWKKHRSGWELRVEAIEPADWAAAKSQWY